MTRVQAPIHPDYDKTVTQTVPFSPGSATFPHPGSGLRQKPGSYPQKFTKNEGYLGILKPRNPLIFRTFADPINLLLTTLFQSKYE